MRQKTILGGKLQGQPSSPDHGKALAVPTVSEENIHIKNPITGKEADIVLSRQGTTDEKLAMILLAPDATNDQKTSILSQYLFERGKESASFLAELYLSKGAHTKETRAFKRQMRFDFESFANTMVLLLSDMASDIEGRTHDAPQALELLAERMKKGADLLTKQRGAITEARMREKGYGIYIDKAGQVYSIFDEEIEKVVKQEREDVISDSKETHEQN